MEQFIYKLKKTENTKTLLLFHIALQSIDTTIHEKNRKKKFKKIKNKNRGKY
jgi:hypothetical protein